MALSKVNYVDNQTVITAQNLNNIQNEIIQNAELIKKAAPRNLLDNSNFRNPVNQRGQASYTGGYGIDRWRVWNSDTLTVNSGYITGNGSVFQYLLPSVVQNSVHTLAAKKTDGSILLYTKNPSEAYSTADNGLGLGVDNNMDNDVVIHLPTGSYLWAALYEGEYTAETLPEYHPKGYMVEALNCGALHVTTTATLDEGQWSNSAPFEQSIVIPGIIESDVPHITPVYSTTNTTAIAQKEAWACVSNAIAENGVIRFICFEDKPTTTIPIQIEVNR